jgi:hypothetical protein
MHDREEEFKIVCNGGVASQVTGRAFRSERRGIYLEGTLISADLALTKAISVAYRSLAAR